MLKYEKYTKHQYESLFRWHFFEIVFVSIKIRSLILIPSYDTLYETKNKRSKFEWQAEFPRKYIRLTAKITTNDGECQRKGDNAQIRIEQALHVMTSTNARNMDARDTTRPGYRSGHTCASVMFRARTISERRITRHRVHVQ